MARYSILITGTFPSWRGSDKDAGVYPDYPFIKAGSQHKPVVWSRAKRAGCRTADANYTF
ncbi:hypothetical protein EB105725_03_01590 [Shimwellia blattae DSM 4481 = NBRC 105725]|nr:hypothetical protein EB105725_03_01590 [Shimwellia blattae DSM 4481 = NBRC 105725]